MKVRRTLDGLQIWWCDGCKTHHWADARWNFDGNVESPTFSPSFLVRNTPNQGDVCHSYVRDGQVQYLNDTTHALKGQTLPLKDV